MAFFLLLSLRKCSTFFFLSKNDIKWGGKKWNKQPSEGRENRRKPSIQPTLFSVDQAERAGKSCGEKCTVGGRGRLGSRWEAAAAGLAPSRWRSPGPRLVPLISAQQQIGPFFTASCCEPLLVFFLVIPPLPTLRVQPGVRGLERPPCWTCYLKSTGMRARSERWWVSETVIHLMSIIAATGLFREPTKEMEPRPNISCTEWIRVRLDEEEMIWGEKVLKSQRLIPLQS